MMATAAAADTMKSDSFTRTKISVVFMKKYF
jgi:hypothetical protein